MRVVYLTAGPKRWVILLKILILLILLIFILPQIIDGIASMVQPVKDKIQEQEPAGHPMRVQDISTLPLDNFIYKFRESLYRY